MENDCIFRVSIWRPARHIRHVDYFPRTSGAEEYRRDFDLEGLYEQVYVWDPGQEDVFLALNDDLSRRFHEALLLDFSPSLPPQKRSLARLAKTVQELKWVLKEEGKSYWADSSQKADSGIGDDINLRVNTAASMLNHLEWVIKSFAHVPGASVVIR